MFLRQRSARTHFQNGKVKLGILLWALGVPIPFVLLFLLIRGCV